ncbi:hypothetical protein ABE41_020260 [Fictibacillus arsenicus]|uniref:Uncharacterized protein n=1 Tax=Fictibacillus arsenicus TaxID=255247 RepID=A0A1B1ZA68_9BACL|nr:hypothetical protein ABE41_020260 [Fictibacillus arsenicus]
MRDSCGISGTGETTAGLISLGAHRTPRGKRVSWSGNQHLLMAAMFTKTAIKKEERRKKE